MDYELIIKAFETMGSDAKWALIVYFLAQAVTKITVVSIIAWTLLKLVRIHNANN